MRRLRRTTRDTGTRNRGPNSHYPYHPPPSQQPVFSAQSYLHYQRLKIHSSLRRKLLHSHHPQNGHAQPSPRPNRPSLPNTPRTIRSICTRVVTLTTPRASHRYRNGWVVSGSRLLISLMLSWLSFLLRMGTMGSCWSMNRSMDIC